MDGDSLVVWALASFHTAALVAVLVVALYLFGPVNWALSGLGTVEGLGLYLALWALTWWATRGVVRAVAQVEDGAAFAVLREGGKWGGVIGACFLWVLLAVAVVPGTAISDVTLEGILLFLFYGGIGSILALGVGGIVGVLFAALDLALFRIARSLSSGDSSASRG